MLVEVVSVLWVIIAQYTIQISLTESKIHREIRWKSSHRLQYSQELNNIFHIHPEKKSLSCVNTAAVLPQDLKNSKMLYF